MLESTVRHREVAIPTISRGSFVAPLKVSFSLNAGLVMFSNRLFETNVFVETYLLIPTIYFSTFDGLIFFGTAAACGSKALSFVHINATLFKADLWLAGASSPSPSSLPNPSKIKTQPVFPPLASEAFRCEHDRKRKIQGPGWVPHLDGTVT